MRETSFFCDDRLNTLFVHDANVRLVCTRLRFDPLCSVQCRVGVEAVVHGMECSGSATCDESVVVHMTKPQFEFCARVGLREFDDSGHACDGVILRLRRCIIACIHVACAVDRPRECASIYAHTGFEFDAALSPVYVFI